MSFLAKINSNHVKISKYCQTLHSKILACRMDFHFCDLLLKLMNQQIIQKLRIPCFSDLGLDLHLYEFLLSINNNNMEILDCWIFDFGDFLLYELLFKILSKTNSWISPFWCDLHLHELF